jgi:hypothetical protein
MIRGMVEVNFPQYIHREARDFFYLTRRALLPGDDLVGLPPGLALAEANGGPGAPSVPGESGVWRINGLPQLGFPYAIATTTVQLVAAHQQARILRVDPRAVRLAGSPGTTEETPTVVSLFGTPVATRGELGIWLVNGEFVALESAPDGGALVAAGVPLAALRSPPRAAVGVQDEDGWLDWVEIPPNAAATPATSQTIDALLSRLGCGTRLYLTAPEARAVLGGSLDLAGNAIPLPTTPSTRLVRAASPSAHTYFETTPIVGPSVWQPLQMQRVRYFPKPSKPVDAGAPAIVPPIAPTGTTTHR